MPGSCLDTDKCNKTSSIAANGSTWSGLSVKDRSNQAFHCNEDHEVKI